LDGETAKNVMTTFALPYLSYFLNDANLVFLAGGRDRTVAAAAQVDFHLQNLGVPLLLLLGVLHITHHFHVQAFVTMKGKNHLKFFLTRK